MAADPERAAAIEGSVARTLRFAADELSNGPDRTASKLLQATTQLDSSDAKEHLAPETIEKFRAQIADLQKKVEEAERAEKAGRIERELKRVLSSLEDEIRTNGSQIESYADRAATKIGASEVRECLAPETIASLQHQLDELRAKAGLGAPPPSAAPSPPPSAPSASAAPSAPAQSAPRPSAPPPSAPPPAASAPPPARPPQAVESEEAQRVKSSVARTLRLAAGEVDAPGWRQAEGYVGQATTQIESDNAKQHLSAETIQGFRAQIAELEVKFAARHRAERIEEIENYLQRLVRDAEEHVEWADRIGSMLAKVTDLLESEDTKAFLPADRAAAYRKDVARIEAQAGGSQRQKAIDDATAPLEELERMVTESSFEGLSEYEAQKVWGGFDTMKDHVGYALDRLPADDATAREIRTRLDAALARRSAAYEATRHKTVMERVSAAWDATLQEVAGWEGETQDTSGAALGEEFLPITRRVVRTVGDKLAGSNLHSPIPDARTEYASDPLVMKIVEDGERMIASGIAKLVKSFDAIMDAAEELPTPADRELGKASTMAQTAREVFAGTPYVDARVERANALLATWESTLEAVRAANDANYAKLSAKAAKAWPAIASSLKAKDGFNPADAAWRGKTVLIDGFYNRVGWDFGNEYHVATWVNDMPVAGDFEPHVLAAFQAAQENERLWIDDHKAWDAVVVIEGPGRVKQRFKAVVKKDGQTVGEIEEWRPVDCVMCRVVALRAGPVAVGPR
jgi:hypothetical protein